MADRNFTQFIPQNAAAPRRPTGKACAPWQKNRKPDTDTAGSAQKCSLRRTKPVRARQSGGVKVRRDKSPVEQTRGFPYRPGLRDGLVRQGRGFPYRTKQIPVMGTPPRDDCRPLHRIQTLRGRLRALSYRNIIECPPTPPRWLSHEHPRISLEGVLISRKLSCHSQPQKRHNPPKE